MLDSYRLLCRRLTAWIVVGLISRWRLAAQAIEFPTTVETHLIFPRNDTYEPAQMFPIVFAIKNTQLAAPLDLNFEYYIYQISPNSSDSVPSGTLDLRWVNWTNSSDPYFAYTYTYHFNNTEADWVIVWSGSSGNCSADSTSETSASNISFYNQNNHLYFSTKKGGKQPDIGATAAADDPTCPSINQGYFSYNVTGVLDWGRPDKYDDHNTCAVISPSHLGPVKATSCGPSLDAAAVSSVEAAMTSKACAALRPAISCPPDAPSSAVTVKGAQFLVGEMAWLTMAAFGGFMYVLVL